MNRRQRRTRDVSVALLVDMSGGAGYRIPPKPGSESAPAVPIDDEPFWQMASLQALGQVGPGPAGHRRGT
jgi:hypothetical protein